MDQYLTRTIFNVYINEDCRFGDCLICIKGRGANKTFLLKETKNSYIAPEYTQQTECVCGPLETKIIIKLSLQQI